MEDNEVLNFVTYKERLADAEARMVLMYYDYTDNNGSNDADWFWQRFVDARNEYRKVRDEFNGE